MATAAPLAADREYHLLIAQYGLQDIGNQDFIGESDEEIAFRMQAELFQEFIQQFGNGVGAPPIDLIDFENHPQVQVVNEGQANHLMDARVVEAVPSPVTAPFGGIGHILAPEELTFGTNHTPVSDVDEDDMHGLYAPEEPLRVEIDWEVDDDDDSEGEVEVITVTTFEAEDSIPVDDNEVEEEPQSEGGAYMLSPEDARGPTTPIIAVGTPLNEPVDRALSVSPFPVICGTCLSPVSRLTSVLCAPCGDQYCQPCLLTFIETCCSAESSFPPRCCGIDIPFSSIRFFLDQDMREMFDEKITEFGTPASERVYCSNSGCAKYLGGFKDEGKIEKRPQQPIVQAYASSSRLTLTQVPAPETSMTDAITIPSTRSIICAQCKTRTCLTCKGPSHDSSTTTPCPALVQAKYDKALDELASSRRWKKCGKCELYVQLNGGCHHITCRCGHQFCYICGKKWKTCQCVQWEENNIIDGDEAVRRL